MYLVCVTAIKLTYVSQIRGDLSMQCKEQACSRRSSQSHVHVKNTPELSFPSLGREGLVHTTVFRRVCAPCVLALGFGYLGHLLHGFNRFNMHHQGEA